MNNELSENCVYCGAEISYEEFSTYDEKCMDCFYAIEEEDEEYDTDL